MTAVRAPSGELSEYRYDEDGLLFAMERGGVRFSIATDQVGTPRVVTDGSGAIVKAIEYDSFGVPLSDSAPSFFLPFGFAGGLSGDKPTIKTPLGDLNTDGYKPPGLGVDVEINARDFLLKSGKATVQAKVAAKACGKLMF